MQGFFLLLYVIFLKIKSQGLLKAHPVSLCISYHAGSHREYKNSHIFINVTSVKRAFLPYTHGPEKQNCFYNSKNFLSPRIHCIKFRKDVAYTRPVVTN